MDGQPRQNTANSLSLEDRTECSGRPGCLEFTGQDTGEERNSQRENSRDPEICRGPSLSIQQSNQTMCDRKLHKARERTIWKD